MNREEVDYWKNFYQNYKNTEPSNFAKFIYNYFDKDNLKLLDVGCGNGRDSYYLSSKYQVTGIDKSSLPKDRENCKFIQGDMVTYEKEDFDIIYSRFTFHSIPDELQEDLVKTIRPNTYLCIETRSDKGLNSHRVHGDTHYRNLTNIDKLKDLLEKYNFEILFIQESDNVAIYKEENPICIRVICKK
jgi:trans-aconitate methyltransferase